VVTEDFGVVGDSDFYFIVAEYFSVVVTDVGDGDFYVIVAADVATDVATDVGDRDFYVVVAADVTEFFFCFC
jgi:hypothetical protein